MQRLDMMAVVLLAAIAMTRLAFAQIPSEVTVNVFPGGFNWAIYVAQERSRQRPGRSRR